MDLFYKNYYFAVASIEIHQMILLTFILAKAFLISQNLCLSLSKDSQI